MSSLGKSLNNCATVSLLPLNANRITFHCKYENFSDINIHGRSYTLQSGDVPNANMPHWSIWVELAADGNYLLLSILPDKPSTITLTNFKVFAVNNKQENMQIFYQKGVITKTTSHYLDNYNSGVEKSYFLCEENGFLTENALLLEFKVDCVVEIDDNVIQSNDLRNGFKRLFDSKQCTDVTLNVGNSTLKAHKAVLIARSSVFSAMFQHDMQEQKLNTITIEDIDPEVLEEMLCYMYTDTAPKLHEMAENLLKAADRYELPNLKAECEQSLQANISVENAACTLMLADGCNAEYLKKKTLDYITANASKIIETPDWEEMIKSGSYAKLVIEIIRALAIKLK